VLVQELQQTREDVDSDVLAHENVLLAAVGTMLTFLTNTYVKTGRHWNDK